MDPRTLVGRSLRSGWRVTAATLDDGPGGRERWTSAAPRRVNGRSSSLRGASVKRCSEAAMPALFRGRARLGRHRRPSDTPRWTSDVVWMSGSQSRRFLEVWSPQMHTCTAQPCNTSRARLVRRHAATDLIVLLTVWPARRGRKQVGRRGRGAGPRCLTGCV